ncbi:hypothetical protein ACG33_10420 [Steroidobacter denitrificans]|uniref:Uncharacterized protein n=1 Tax=Steroidobacter denitrificans TaxID=465721 RepID=A0A127FAQ7_STEDE|nr:DUF6516 family protein [Steroidobacter denitrificans]AMN47504.1 hypothetical protein ACG33_10420 [Steroidobacter denitrificans]
MPWTGDEYTLEFLLEFDGRIHKYGSGHFLKFEIKRVPVTATRPHGLSYSLTLHAPEGTRLIGFDNAHGVPPPGSRFNRRPAAADHWHRTPNDPGRPYIFKDADTLLADFFKEVYRVIDELEISDIIVAEEERQKR